MRALASQRVLAASTLSRAIRDGRVDFVTATVAITDWLLFASHISDPARFILGLALEHPDHAPSKAQIRAALPIRSEDVASARREIAHKRLAYVDRPAEKTPGTPRFNRAVRLRRFATQVDHRLRGALYTILPTALTRRLRGRGGLAACRLLALYQREQMQRGAVQIPDNVAAWLLGWPITKAQTARRRLLKAGVIEEAAAATSSYPAVYVIPDAHASAPPEPNKLDPAKTRTLERIELGDRSPAVYASAAERKLLVGRTTKTQPESLSRVLEREPVIAETGIDALGDEAVVGSQQDQDAGLHLGVEIQTTSPRDTDQISSRYRPETTPPHTSHLVSLDRSASATREARGDEEQSSTEERATAGTARREWGPDWSNVFYFASEDVHRQIQSFVHALLEAYGLEDTRGYLRQACLGSKARGTAVLERLRHRFPGRDPDLSSAEDTHSGEPPTPLAGTEAKTVSEAVTIAASLPRTTAVLLEALGGPDCLPDVLEDDLTLLAQMHRAQTPEQLEILDGFVSRRLRRLAPAPGEKHVRLSVLSEAIEEATHSNELYAAVSAARPAEEEEPPPEPEADLVADLLEGVTRDVAAV